MYGLAWYSFRVPDLSAFDTPVPTLMKEREDSSAQHEDVLKRITGYYDAVSSMKLSASIAARRKVMEDLFVQEVDATITPVDVSGIPSEWVMADGASADRRLLYLHGGSFNAGSPRSHRYIIAELSRRAGAAVLAIDYRLMPKYKQIDCHEDARAAYRWILDHGPDGDAHRSSSSLQGIPLAVR